jgi:hypothetical protein
MDRVRNFVDEHDGALRTVQMFVQLHEVLPVRDAEEAVDAVANSRPVAQRLEAHDEAVDEGGLRNAEAALECVRRDLLEARAGLDEVASSRLNHSQTFGFCCANDTSPAARLCVNTSSTQPVWHPAAVWISRTRAVKN